MFCLLLLRLIPVPPPPFSFLLPPAASATDQPDRLTCLPKLLRCVSIISPTVRVPNLRSLLCSLIWLHLLWLMWSVAMATGTFGQDSIWPGRFLFFACLCVCCLISWLMILQTLDLRHLSQPSTSWIFNGLRHRSKTPHGFTFQRKPP